MLLLLCPFGEQSRILPSPISRQHSLVEEPSRGIRGNYPFGDGWNNRCISSGILCWRSISKAYNGSSLGGLAFT
uniref:Uncharacterized protein n=1 Tax=Brassica oleracea TaxID=3712 RepID=A0A3P6DL33_BRAOL|nr:unnamed protein product [Brassica oleracea]